MFQLHADTETVTVASASLALLHTAFPRKNTESDIPKVKFQNLRRCILQM